MTDIIFPTLPPRLRVELDQILPGFYHWFQDASRFFELVVYKGSLTLTAGTATTVSDVRVLSTSSIVLQETNAAAVALATRPYIYSKTAGTGFLLSHAAAGGTETFDYILFV